MNIGLTRKEWGVVVLTVLLLAVPLAEADINAMGHAKATLAFGRASGGPYEKWQAIGAVAQAGAAFLTLGVLWFQALVFERQRQLLGNQKALQERQVVLTARQIALEEHRLIVEFRPKITARKVSFLLEDDDSITVCFAVFNRGQADGRIGSIASSLLIQDGAGSRAGDSLGAVGFDLPAGASIERRLRFSPVMRKAYDARDSRAVSEFHCIIHYLSSGYISDRSSRPYITEFSKVARGADASFSSSGDADDNYED